MDYQARQINDVVFEAELYLLSQKDMNKRGSIFNSNFHASQTAINTANADMSGRNSSFTLNSVPLQQQFTTASSFIEHIPYSFPMVAQYEESLRQTRPVTTMNNGLQEDTYWLKTTWYDLTVLYHVSRFIFPKNTAFLHD